MKELENIKDHILVCLSSSPSNKKVIDTASRMAKVFNAEFTLRVPIKCLGIMN